MYHIFSNQNQRQKRNKNATKSDKSVCGLRIEECRGETRPGGANCSQFYFLTKKRLIPCEGAINLDPVFSNCLPVRVNLPAPPKPLILSRNSSCDACDH